jgi:phosphoglycerol transferase
MRLNYYIVITALALLLNACDNPVTSSNKSSVTSSAKQSEASKQAPEIYQATRQEGITFNKPGYPSFIKEVKGMSGLEPTGRWTDGPSAVFVLKEPVKGFIQLKLSGTPYGPNAGKKVSIFFGGLQRDVVFNGKSSDFENISASFYLQEPADTLEIRIPEPTIPSGGNRKLGIFLQSLKLIE